MSVQLQPAKAGREHRWGEVLQARTPGCYPGGYWFESNRPSKVKQHVFCAVPVHKGNQRFETLEDTREDWALPKYKDERVSSNGKTSVKAPTFV